MQAKRFLDLCQKRESLKDAKGSEAQPRPVEEPIKSHAPPPRMKLLTLKYYRKLSETTNNKSTSTKPKTSVEKAPALAKKPLTEMKKVDLVRSLDWRHPSVGLEILDHLSERIKPKDEDEDEDEGEDEGATDTKRLSNSDLDEKKGFGPRDFLPKDKDDDEDKAKDKKKTSAGVVVNHLIDWLVAGHFYKPLRRRDEIVVKMPYTPTYLVRSVVQTMQQEGTLEASIDIRIQGQISAVENFLFFNKHTNNSRRIVPITTSQQSFVSFSERELGAFFWKREVLKRNLCELALQDSTRLYSIDDLDCWIGSKEPGFIIKRFTCDVGLKGLTSRKKKAGHRAAVRMWALDDIRSHLQQFLLEDEKKVKKNAKEDKEKDFHPAKYKKKGYVLRRLILTVGFRVKLQAFKLRKLKDEIQNVLTCKEDTQRFSLGVDVKDIRTLTLDAGQACVIEELAHLSEELQRRRRARRSSKIYPSTTLSPQNICLLPLWAKSEKGSTLVGQDRSVTDIETHLPPMKGPSSNVINYIKELERVEEQLKGFYNGPDAKYKRHKWDMQRALHGEFQLIAHRLLGIVGEGLRIRSVSSKPVIINVGLSKFGTKSGLTSLHSTFLSYFISLARSLGYIVLGLNEYYTSKKCLACGLFVAQVDLRRFFCSHCQVYHHRDIMAAENMANIIQGYLFDQQRPDHLHPVAPDGTMPWKQEPSRGSNTSPGTVGTSSTTGPTSIKTAAGGSAKTAPPSKKRQRKRSSTVSSLEQSSSKQIAKIFDYHHHLPTDTHIPTMAQQKIELQDLDLQQLVEVKKQLEEELSHLTSSFGQLKQAQNRFADCIESCKAVDASNKDKTILVPLTSSLYVPGKLANVEKVIVDIGTGYYVEKTTEDAIKFYNSKVDFVKENLEKIQATVVQKQGNLRSLVDMMQYKLQIQQQDQKAAVKA
ncbi:subunit of tubulin prefoldin [Haplosporangium gracile]|nr:subunit of tubulin prefoldin [Haplosporangium gracile]